MNKRVFRKHFSMLLSLIMLFSIMTSSLPQLVSATTGTLESSIVNQDGTVTFSYQANDSTDSVNIAGDFNSWTNDEQMTKDKNNIWSITKKLQANKYEYKFIVDGDWITDPLNDKEANGNSQVIVPGLKDNLPNEITLGEELNLSGLLLKADGTEESVKADWTLKGKVDGVTITGDKLSISEIAPENEKITIVGQYDGYELIKEIIILGNMYEYTINYSRNDGNQSNWDMWLWGDGSDGQAYPFTTSTDDGFAQAKVKFKSDQINLITRPGSWDQQEEERSIQISEGKNSVEVWIIEGETEVFYSKDAIGTKPKKQRSIQLTYEREDNDYEDWNIWVWDTGAKDGEILFDEITDKGAVSTFEIGSRTTSVGFVIRKGQDWNNKDAYGEDRYITVDPKQNLTKVIVKSGVGEIYTVPTVNGPVFEQDGLTFYYRDQELYEQNAMDTIESVKLKINDATYDMNYENQDELFKFSLNDLEQGEYNYTFLVTIDGETTEVTDPFNTIDGKSTIAYRNLDMSMELDVQPNKISSNENAVLSVGLNDDVTDSISKIYVDTTALGGSDQLMIDPVLNKQTIAVEDTITAGKKELAVTIVDIYGNTHKDTVSVEVVPRTSVGELDFDWDEARIYFMLTDRFYDGDPTNNDPNGNNYDITHPETYHGGDFQGIIDKLDYLDDLGINTIWITPIVDNIDWDLRYNNEGSQYGYHGYWAKDFTKIDEHLGNIEVFKKLIDKAHDRGIKIMVDVVLNHTGYGLKENDSNIGLNIKNYPTAEDRERFAGMLRDGGTDVIKGELAGLPDFITEDPVVREQIIKWQTDWLEKVTTERGDTIDYFRVDTVKHVEDTTWKAFKNALTEIKPDFKLIGEHFGASVNNTGGYLGSGQMDSLLDFNFKDIAADFINGKIDQVESILEDRNEKITNTATLGQFLSSHDEDGFLISRADGNLDKMKVAASLQITAKGQPVVYYGEELGQSGKNAGDMDKLEFSENRYDLAWDQVEDNEMLDHYQKVLAFRADFSKVLSKGDRTKIAGSDADEFLLFERDYQGESVYVGLNLNDESQNIQLELDSSGAVIIDHYSGTTFETTSNQTVSISIPSIDQGGTVLLEVKGGKIVNSNDQPDETAIPANTLRVHYENKGDFSSGLGLWVWEDVQVPSEQNGSWPDAATPFTEENQTDYGAYIDVPLADNAEKVGMLVNNNVGTNVTGDIFVNILAPEMNEIWVSEDGKVSLVEPVNLSDNQIRIHYQREDGKYEPWGMWTWEDVAEPTDDWPMGAHAFSNDQVGKHGAFIDIDLIEDAQKIGFLLLERVEAGSQTDDMTFDELDKYNQLFIREGDHTVYTNPYYVLDELIDFAEMVSSEKIEIQFLSLEGITEEELNEDITIVDKEGQDVSFDRLTIDGEKSKVTIHGSFDVNQAPYTIMFRGGTVTADKGWKLTDELYSYEGDLGATLHADGTATLKLWSPSADQVSVILYDQGADQDEVIADDIEMVLGERGVWEVTLDKNNTGLADLTGYYYHYEIERDGEKVLALDPYAKSMATWNSENTANIPVGKAAIVDPSTIGPQLDFANIDGYEKREDAIIYEVHVRDFTSDPSIAEDLQSEFGTFSAFIEKLDYLEDLGVTHVQLLPVMSYFFANEFDKAERLLEYSSTNNNYNWGYDPHSYFSLTGMYSEQPDDPEKRIEEFKLLIDEIHSRGMGVILDVVYNHTARVSHFEDLEPNYYHFMNADGSPRESFGGGRLGTTHEMARRILVDSITYWVEEFKVDGFRFDMMGDHDAETIQMAYDEAKEINPNIVMIGEGWVTFTGDENGGDIMPADQHWMQYTQAVGSFSDDMRNELKSGFGSEGEPRFLTGGARNIQHIYDNVTANPHNFTADDPGDVVSYIAAHDNLTLHDVIAQSIKKDPKDHQEEIHQRIRLGNTMVLTAQGTPFLHAGQEFGRTKQFKHEDYKGPVENPPYKSTYMEDEDGNPFEYPYFIHDSYDSTDAINMIEWEKATNDEKYPIHVQTREYTKGLIELRRSTDAFRLGTMDEIAENVSMIEAPEIKGEDLIIGYQAKSTSGEETYYVFVNGDSETRTLTLAEDLTDGIVIVDGEEAGIVEITNPSGVTVAKDQITIDPLTAVVVKVSDDDEGPSGEGEPDKEDEDPNGGEGSGENDGDLKEDGKTPGKDEKEENGEEVNDDEKSSKDEQEPLITDNDQEGEGLPKTASNMFNYLIVGLLLLVSGFGVFLYKRKVNKRVD